MVVPREDNLTIEGFKGLSTSIHPSLIKDDQFSELYNFTFDKAGSLQRRRGLYINIDFKQRTVSPPLGTDQSIVSFGSYDVTTAGGGHWYLGTAQGKPWVSNAFDPDSVFMITGFAAADLCVGMTQYKNVWYFITNGGVYKATPGASPAATLIAGSPKGAAFCQFKDRLWVVQVDSPTTSSLSSTIQYCAAGNFDSWDPASIINVASGVGDVVTCLVPYSDRIIVFKKFSIWNIYLQGGDFPISAVRLLTSGRGAISTRSVVVVNEIIYFMAHDGIYRTDGNAFSEISDAVQNYFEYGPARFAYDQDDWIAYYDDHLYIKASSPTYNITRVIDYGRFAHPGHQMTDQGGFYYMTYNIALDAWGEEIYPTAAQIGSLTRPALARNERGDILFLQGATDRLYSRQNKYYVDDLSGTHTIGPTPVWTKQPIPVGFITKRYSVDRQTRVKRLKYGYIAMEGVTVTPSVQFTVDGAARGFQVADPAAVDRYGAYKIPGCGYFRTFQLTLVDNAESDLRVDMLHYILHTKRQLAETPR